MNWFKNPATGLMTMKAKLGIGLALLVALGIALASAYFVGYGKGKNISAVEITKYEGKVKDLRGQLATANAKVTTKVVTEYVTQLAYQDRIVYRNRDIIRTAIQPVPYAQTVTKGFIYAHNQSALGLAIDFDLAKDVTPSGVQDSTVLDTVAENYAIDHRNKAKLDALQKWVSETYENSKKVADAQNH